MSMSVEWDALDRARWEELFSAAGRSPLVQSWAWGAAKETGGWRCRRALVRRDGEPVALAQVLERRLAGLVRLGRLNRGPVWLRDDLPLAERLAVLAAVRAPWRVWRLGALALAPELPAEAADRVAGGLCWRRAGDSWRSAWIDLSRPLDQLRRGLDGKWRNMLNASEKAGLVVEVREDAAALDWLLDRYAGLLSEKGFSATPPDLVRALAARSFRPGDVLVLRALSGDEAVAGILLARHGAAATYLIGWNGDAGRKLKANNRLLWEAVAELRRRGLAWLDLGGIDSRLTPGIAAFKRGMNGEEYGLAGEFAAL